MYKYIVKKVEPLSPTTVLITMSPSDSKKTLSFLPGQYAAIGYYRHGRPSPMRCFSIASTPSQTDMLQFGLRVNGHFTKGIAKLVKGDKMTVEGAYGGFIMISPRDLDTVFLAGGIGITPFMSMIRTATINKMHNKIWLLYGCQSQDDVPFFEELMHLQTVNPNFRVQFFIGNGPTGKLKDAEVYPGRISPENLDVVANNNYGNKSFFICGPPPFMKALTNTLLSKGVQHSKIITEAFGQGPNRQTGKLRSWPFNMYVLSAASMAVAAFFVMVTDLFKTLPPATILKDAKKTANSTIKSSRQKDLDQLVNSYQFVANTAPLSSGVVDANKKAEEAAKTNQVANTTSSQNKTTSTSGTTTSTTGTSSTSSSSTTTPSPAPTPVCTTSPSGVKTCI